MGDLGQEFHIQDIDINGESRDSMGIPDWDANSLSRKLSLVPELINARMGMESWM